jgi:FkbM family methyltransferase
MSATRARVVKLARLAAAPSLWPVCLAGVAPGMEHGKAFGDLSFDSVVDVGANKGQFAAFAAWRWPKARLYCYEPLAGPRETLQRVLAKAAPGRSEARPRALGTEAGISEMHVATREDSSSLLSLGEAQRRIFAMDEAALVPVTVGRLADEPGLDDLGRALLKIDVQGFEYEVLAGAAERLGRFDTVYVECSFTELYRGQKLAAEVEALLRANGFLKAGAYNASYHAGAPVQADLLFRRSEPRG